MVATGVNRLMRSALVVGGTSYIGRAIVETFLAAGYDVTSLSRGNHDAGVDADERLTRLTGDRTEAATIERAAEAADPDVVVDNAAYSPADVETAVEVFGDADAYVYVSSVGAYDHDRILKYERDTPLEPCSAEQATDDSFGTYPNRKAEGDRLVFEAAERGVAAMSVRPTMVYGPHNHLPFLQYWIDRAVSEDRIVVPGDGSYVAHRTYVEDVASAIRTVAEDGRPGEAYNVADRQPLSVDGTLDLVCEVADTEVERVYASPRELADADLSPAEFPLFMGDPFVMATDKLSALGWESTPAATAMERTIDYHREAGLSEYDAGPSRAAERRLLDDLA